ncbi:Probable methyltransferase At1g27930 [Linum grandiflorum]
MMKSKSRLLPEKSWILAVSMAFLVFAGVLISSFIRSSDPSSFLCSLSGGTAGNNNKSLSSSSSSSVAAQLNTIVHYATSRTTPQQNIHEISVTLKVLLEKMPCNFLVFGLGFDSLMWNSLNPGGTTIFLEEDPSWVKSVLKDAPTLHAHTVKYRTQLKESDRLMKSYRKEPLCSPGKAYLKGNLKCPLALATLPEEIYEKEWDLIMIDAPRGYFPEAPGRMAAIFSAAVMARARKGDGVTHVFLHDVDRKVEKRYAEEFLCRKYLVKGVGRLWHFEIPAAGNVTGGDETSWFC